MLTISYCKNQQVESLQNDYEDKFLFRLPGIQYIEYSNLNDVINADGCILLTKSQLFSHFVSTLIKKKFY